MLSGALSFQTPLALGYLIETIPPMVAAAVDGDPATPSRAAGERRPVAVTVTADPADLRAAVAAARARERERYFSPVGRRRQVRLAGLAILAGGLVISILASLAFGARGIAFSTVLDALFAFDPANTDHLVVHDLGCRGRSWASAWARRSRSRAR